MKRSLEVKKVKKIEEAVMKASVYKIINKNGFK